ncbi:MAG: hypothetical protein Q9182_006480 [Xanthomendoza sp. 2 TL-2023]
MRAITLVQTALVVVLFCPVVEVVASRQEAKATVMGLVDATTKGTMLIELQWIDESTRQDDLDLITDSPGPPTIQPGIPALQPSIPTSGVASLCIPPAHQISSLKSSDPCVWVVPNPPPPSPVVTPPSASSPSIAVVGLSLASVSSTTAHISMTTSIPFLSELMSQLFSHSTQVTVPSLSTPAQVPTFAAPWPSTAGTPTVSATTALSSPTPPALQADPKDMIPPTLAPSMLVYSFTLPPYAGGLDTTGIVETMTKPSLAEGKDKSFSHIYSYSLPPYTPKTPTYVATSARLAPVDMTSGGPGGSGGAVPTDRIFLQKGFVDPSKDLVLPASSVIPLYSPACLGNAYGGGYVITPTMSIANTNATGIAKVPPAYVFTYKLEPTQALDYGGAVILVDTKNPVPTRAPSPNSVLYGGGGSTFDSAYIQPSGIIPGTNLPLKDAPHILSKDLTQTSTGSNYETNAPDKSLSLGADLPPKDLPQVPSKDSASTPTANVYGTSLLWGSLRHHVSEPPQSSGAEAGTLPGAKDDTTTVLNSSVLTSSRPIHGTNLPGNTMPVSVLGSTQASEARTGSPSSANDKTTIIQIIPLPVSTESSQGSSALGNTPPASVSGSLKTSGAFTRHTPPANHEPILSSQTSGGRLQSTNIAGSSVFAPIASVQPSEGGGDESHLPASNAPTTDSDDVVPTSQIDSFGTTSLVSSLLNPDVTPTVRASVMATRIKSIVVTTETTWCPSTAPDHLSIISSILSYTPLSAAPSGSRVSVNGNYEGQPDDAPYAHITSLIPLGAVTISTATVTITRSAVASIRPQDQLHRAALAFDSTVTDSNGAVSTEHFSSEVNGTLTLPLNGSEVVPFQGKSSRPTARAIIATAVLFLIAFAL